MRSFKDNPDTCDAQENEDTSGASNRTAILLLDFQNEFAKKGGKLHNQVSAVMDETGMLH